MYLSTFKYYFTDMYINLAQGTLFKYLIIPIGSIVFFYNKDKLNADIKEYTFWKYSAILAIIFIILAPFFSGIIDRLFIYLIPFKIFIFTKLYEFLKSTLRYLYILSFIFYTFAYLAFWFSFGINSFAWVPYQIFMF